MRWRVLLCALLTVFAARADEFEAIAVKFVDHLWRGQFAKASEHFDEPMRAAMPAAKLEETWKLLAAQVGPFQRQEGTRRESARGYQIVFVRCEFQRAALEARLVFDAQHKISGLWFGPARDATPPAKESGEAVELQIPTGKLAGTLEIPAGSGPFPAVVLVAGSGPTDRNGNQALARTDNLKKLSAELAARGFAVLRYDKRGVGGSAAALTREEDARLDTYADDVAGWVDWLRKDGRFNRVAIVGHSEGSLLGMLAAKRTQVDALVSLAGAGRPAAVVLREQLSRNLAFTQQIRQQADKILEELTAGRQVQDVPGDLMFLFRPSVQPYLISWLAVSPAEEIAALDIPVLIVQGTTDLQVSVADADALASSKKDAERLILEGMSHALKQANSPLEQQAAYTDPSLPLSPLLADGIATFLKKYLAP